MENFYINKELEIEDERLSSLLKCLETIYDDHTQNFARLCWTIYKIKNYCADLSFKVNKNRAFYGYFDSQTLLGAFGFDRNAVSRYANSFFKFCEGNTFDNVCVKTDFKLFSPSKLFELLPLSSTMVFYAIDKKLIRPEMTVKEIRAYVKSFNSQEPEKVVEEIPKNSDEIPMVYNPKQEYEFSYFENKTKNQLLNIVWQLQQEYQKLLKEKKK